MKEPAHLALHPFGQIPTYEEGDLALFETGAPVVSRQRYRGFLIIVASYPHCVQEKSSYRDGRRRSVDLYFRPTALRGKESNWIKTLPGPWLATVKYLPMTRTRPAWKPRVE